MFYKLLQIFMLSCIIFFSCATKPKTYTIVEVTLIENRDGREHMYDRTLFEGKAVWYRSHEQYELVDGKRL